MANPINPFSGGGGWGNVIPESYLPFTSEMTERWKSEKDAKTENILGTIAGTIGGLTGNAELANTLFPSAIGKYYQQASEAQGKAKAYEGLVKTSPELFGLSGDQAKAFTDFASKLPPIAVPEFYQMALKGGMAQQELGAKMMAGKKAPLNLEGLDQGFMQAIQGSPAQPPAAISAQAMPEQGATETPSSGTSPKPVAPTIAEMDEFDKLHPNLQPGVTYVDTLSKWIRQKRGLQ